MVDMTPWRISKDCIMEIANRKGWFGVPRYLYRAEGMTKKCKELVKEGKLKRARKKDDRDTMVYVPVVHDCAGGGSDGART
jgi:hypothetical protein